LGKVIYTQASKIEKGNQNITIDFSQINMNALGTHYLTTTFQGKVISQTLLLGGE
jgi:hypothetical protein